MKLTAQQLFDKLRDEFHIIGQKGTIHFTLNDLRVEIKTKDTVGNLVQEWLKEWMRQENIEFEESTNTQTFPDVYLDSTDKTNGLLEIKSFDFDRGPGFDLANFESYCGALLEDSYKLDCDYLIVAYQMKGGELRIKNIWLKKIWEISGPSGPYPLKVQEKKQLIYNIRPVKWYGKKAKFRPFGSKESFLSALNNTRYQYHKTRSDNSHWLRKVIKNYKDRTGSDLVVT